MSPTATNPEETQRVLRSYKSHVRAIVAEHKVKMQKAIEEVDQRKAKKISQGLKKNA